MSSSVAASGGNNIEKQIPQLYHMEDRRWSAQYDKNLAVYDKIKEIGHVLTIRIGGAVNE